MKSSEKYKRQLEASRRWKERNKENVKAYRDKWAAENSDLKLKLTKKWKELNKEKVAAHRKRFDQDHPNYHKDRHLRSSYGITLEQYNEIADLQGNKCCVCGKHAEDTHRKRLFVDHCHSTGEIRGLLCQQCNTALGMVDDNADLLYRLAAYLMEFR